MHWDWPGEHALVQFPALSSTHWPSWQVVFTGHICEFTETEVALLGQ